MNFEQLLTKALATVSHDKEDLNIEVFSIRGGAVRIRSVH